MTRRNHKRIDKERRARRLAAMARPELSADHDRFVREAQAGVVSAPRKVVDPQTRALIDAALARRNPRERRDA